MRYLSWDIETTGLDPEYSDILEIGCIIEDTKNPLPFTAIPKFHCFVYNEMRDGQPIYRGSLAALSMHAELFNKMQSFDLNNFGFNPPQGLFLHRDNVLDYLAKFLRENGLSLDKPITIAGKNFAAFDLQFLKQLRGWGETFKIHHRYLDPGSLYFNPALDLSIPSLEVCKSRAQLQYVEVQHNALLDAWDVIQVLRYKFSELTETNE